MKNIVYSKVQNNKDRVQEEKGLQYTHEEEESEYPLKTNPNNQNIPELDNLDLKQKNGFQNAEAYVQALKEKNKKMFGLPTKEYQDSISWLRKEKKIKNKQIQFSENYRQTIKSFSKKQREKVINTEPKKVEIQPKKYQKYPKDYLFTGSNEDYYVALPTRRQETAFVRAQSKNRQRQVRPNTSRSHSKYTQKASQKILDEKVNKLMGILCRETNNNLKRMTLQKSKGEGLKTMRSKQCSDSKRKKPNLQQQFNNFFCKQQSSMI